MEITNFCPMILSPKADEAIELFEALGFERTHTKGGISDADASACSMKNPDGFYVVATQVDQLPQAMTAIQINVSDFDEMYELLLSKGFVNAQGDKVTDTGTSKAAMMMSPSGFALSISQHIRN